ncbi:MAG: argininosuccinate lyase [Microthrixaceae bacterium]
MAADEPHDHDHDRPAPAPLWHGRFATGPSESLWEYTVSLPFDRRLAPFDLAASAVHVRGLGDAAILSDEEVESLLRALDVVGREIEEGAFGFEPTDEDIHTAIERRVTEIAGDAGARVHTGRSRNDQVATAFRLFCKQAAFDVAVALVGLCDVLLTRAVDAGEAYLPGYTHLQQAQPVLLAHHWLAHFWAFSRDLDRVLATRERLDVSPLGAGALAGSSLPLDPAVAARRMGFSAVFDNSLDAVSDRDFAAELLFDLVMVGVHLSRIGEEIVVWSTSEFGFVRLDERYSTGSSMLPQKKNPDIAELARGKAGRLIGNLTGLLATLKALPLSYNRDLQEDKEPVFDALDQITRGISAVAGMVSTLTTDLDAMASSADNPVAGATDLAELLVRRGIPFRQAHAIVGDLVRRHLDGEEDLVALVRAEPRLGEEGAALLAPGMAVRQRRTPGGGGPGPVSEQRRAAAERLRSDRERVEALAGTALPPAGD